MRKRRRDLERQGVSRFSEASPDFTVTARFASHTKVRLVSNYLNLSMAATLIVVKILSTDFIFNSY